MSNLYKQWYVRTEEANTRVINSDAILGSYIEKKKAKTLRPADKDGFRQGIAASEVEPAVQEEEASEILARAKKEAEYFLTQAKQQADTLIGKAKEEEAEIRENARKQGIADGKAWMEQEIEKRKAQIDLDYQSDRKALETEYLEKRSAMEAELVDVILTVFNKVFHIQFDNKKQILMALIQDAIMNIEGEKRFRIKVAEDNVLFVEKNKEEILNRVGHDIELEILADPGLDGNGCIIETDSGVFDCGLGTQLENLIKDIKSLCS